MSVVINGSGTITGVPGAVLQVISAVKDTASTTTSTSFVAASLTLSITPTSSTSKILIMVNGVAYATSGGESMITVYRNATTNLGLSNGFQKATGGNSQSISFQYLDSPATTSATSYDVYLKASSGVTAYFGESLYRSVITLMEIAA